MLHFRCLKYTTRCAFRHQILPQLGIIRSLSASKRIHISSGAWKCQKGLYSGPWDCQNGRQILYDVRFLLSSFWFQGIFGLFLAILGPIGLLFGFWFFVFWIDVSLLEGRFEPFWVLSNCLLGSAGSKKFYRVYW